MNSLFLSFIMLIGTAGAAGAQLPPTLVVVDQVSSMKFNNQVTLIGRTEARASSAIVAVVAGIVMEVNVGEGVPVSRGDALMTLDPKTIDLYYQAKRAEAKEAEAQATLADQTLERAEELFAEHAIAQSRLDSERAAAKAAHAHFEQLLAEEKRLKIDLDNCTIRTPLTGYTSRKLVDVGEWVKLGDPVFEVVDLSEIKITVDLPERHFGHLSIGSPVIVVVSGDQKNTVSGIVTGIAPSASAETHTFPVYVAVDNAGGRLGGGMLVRATLSLDETFTSLAVSKDAVIRQSSGELIYTIADGKAAPITISSGSTNGSMVAISGEGLKEGMTVVVRGNERIFPGAPVRTAGGGPGSGAPDGEGAPKSPQDKKDPEAGDKGGGSS